MVLLVGLRMAIGWQLLYEGLWKIDTLDSPRPWTAEGYLKNSRGPVRSFFREMTGDPSDYNWLDYESVAARWDVWHEAYVKHYGLDESQTKKLEEQVNGFKDFRAVLEELPGDWTEEKFNKQVKSVKFHAKSKRLIVDGKQRLTPREKNKLLSLAKDNDEKSKTYQKAVSEVYLRATRNLSAKEKLLAMLEGDSTRTGLVLATDGSAEWTTEDDFQAEQEKLDEKMRKEINEVRRGSIELFKSASARYESRLSSAQQAYDYKHLDYDFQELQKLRTEAIGPIKALEKEMKANAAKLLTEKQLTMPPVDLPWTRMDWINFQTIAGLTVLGFLLIGGLFTRTAAVLAAGMLFMFYLAMPPLPGLPPAPGPEHSYIINKNRIEMLALLALAAFPTGQWFGLDSVISWLRGAEKETAGGSTDALSQTATAPAESTAAPASDDSSAEASETAGADGGGDCAPEG